MRQLIDSFLRKVALDFHYGHGTDFIGFLVRLDVGNCLDEIP